ncbi:MAG: hypothetical protein DRZ76_03925 [Candidatus Nealsonbacteria bacterium]|nr:MAG: hypothetical protein DRZ76_03925 [Candidatus Nealsonbacteria bacterium]
MAQTQSPTIKLYRAAAEAIKGESSFSKFTHIALDEGDMSSFNEQTNALASECSVSGLTRVAATVTNQTTTYTNDTVQAYHQFTAAGDASITGFGIFDSGSGGNLLMWCAFAASLALESGDKLACTGKAQFKLGV